MRTNRNQFIHSLFSFLEPLRYTWLKAILEHPIMTPQGSDIDILVHPDDLPKVIEFIEKQPELANCWRTEVHGALFLHLLFEDGSFLKLDLLTKLVRKQWTYLPTGDILDSGSCTNGVDTCSPLLLFEHVFLFNILNGAGLPPKYIEHFEQLPSNVQRSLVRFINGKYETDFQSISDLGQFKNDTRKNTIRHLRSLPENRFFQRAKNLLQHYQKTAAAMLHTRGQVVTFSGVDGAGKTTLLNDLRTLLEEECNRKVVVLRHRPSLLPILSAWTKGKQAAEAQSMASLPRQGNNQSIVGSLLRFGYYFTDYLLGQCYVWGRYLLPGYTVIYDRYYFDFIVDGKRSNIALGERLPKWLYRFVAKPGLNVFLYADPAVIRQRKQEMPVDDIQQMTGRYRSLFGELASRFQGQYLCIENNDRQQSLTTIVKHYAKTA